jgi:hypothetical protein
LDQLSQDWSLARGDKDCVQQIYTQAINDGFEYWNKIGDDHGCKDKSVEHRAKVCSGKFGFDENFNFLNVMKQILEFPQGSGCSKTGGAASAQPQEPVTTLGKDMAPIIARVHNPSTGESGKKSAKKSEKSAAQAATNPKDGASPSIEKRTEQKEKPAEQKEKAAQTAAASAAPVAAPAAAVAAPAASAGNPPNNNSATCSAADAKRGADEAIKKLVSGCLGGAVTQFVNEIWELAEGAVKTIAHPIDTIHALSDFIAEFARNPEVAAEQVIEAYAEEWPKDACAPLSDRMPGYCKVATKVFLDAFSLVSGGVVIKGGAKAIKFIARNAAKGLNVAGKKVATKAGSIATKVGRVVPTPVKNAAASVGAPLKTAATATANQSRALARSTSAAVQPVANQGRKIVNEVKAGAGMISLTSEKAVRDVTDWIEKTQRLAKTRSIMYVESTQLGNWFVMSQGRPIMKFTVKAGKLVTWIPVKVLKGGVWITKWVVKKAVTDVVVGGTKAIVEVSKRAVVGVPLVDMENHDRIEKINKEHTQKVKDHEDSEEKNKNGLFDADLNDVFANVANPIKGCDDLAARMKKFEEDHPFKDNPGDQKRSAMYHGAAAVFIDNQGCAKTKP